MLVLLALAGCGLKPERGDGAVVPPEQLYLDLADQALPSGLVGERYEYALQISGGEPPYTFLEVDPLPGGLRLGQDDGHLTGVATQAGVFTFAVGAVDSKGRSKRALLTMTIGLEPQVVECGQTISGRFDGGALNVDGTPDLGDLGGVEWLAIDLPDELVTRVDLQFRNDAQSTLWVQQPGELVGSWELDELYVPKSVDAGYPSSVLLDAGSDPSLTGFATQPLLPMVLVATTSGDWELTVECSDGPVFVTTSQYPVELGTEFLYDYEVYGNDNDAVRIWTDDPLPPWIVWDEATGVVTSTTGLAEETGAWELTINAETPDGRIRSERTIFGVFDVTTVACGETAPLTLEDGYFDGEFYSYYDVKGYDVLRVDLVGQQPSEITLRATGSDAHYLGLAEPEPDWLKFYGGAERVYLDGEAALSLDPSTYPATHHYRDATELYFSAGSAGIDLAGVQVTVECGFDPLPDHAALPVFDPLQPVDLQLEAIGGEPPYLWSGTGFPAGLTLQRDGRLVGSTSATGEFPVSLTVTDRSGASGTRAYTLQVGTEAACLGHRRVYCGESFSNEFTEAYYNDNGSNESTRTFCLVHTDETSVGVELYSEDGQYRVDLADPGISDPDDVVAASSSTYVEFVDRNRVEGLAIDSFSWPRLDDYDHLPIFVTLRAYDPGEWTARFVCTP